MKVIDYTKQECATPQEHDLLYAVECDCGETHNFYRYDLDELDGSFPCKCGVWITPTALLPLPEPEIETEI